MPSPFIAGFILAAGEGRRLRPATLKTPKALIPFCGVPLLELAAAQLSRLPLSGIAVNAWHLADQIQAKTDFLRQHEGWDLRLSREPQLLDTGGGLRYGLRLLPDAEHILVHNADVTLDTDLQILLDVHLAQHAAATALLVPGRGPQTVDLASDGRITSFRRPRGKGEFTFSGIHIFRRDILKFLPERDVCSIIDAYEAALKAGLPVLGISTGNAFWSDLGTAVDYIRAHGVAMDAGLQYFPRLRLAQAEQARRRAALEREGVRCTGALGIGSQLSVPPGTHLHNVVLWDQTRIAHPALYADSIFTGDPVFPPPVNNDRFPDPRIYASLDLKPGECQTVPLRLQGSGRRYCRLSAGTQSWIWCAYNHSRRENASYAAIADFLERIGLKIPSILIHLGDVGEMVSRDLGGSDLQALTDPVKLAELLHKTLLQAARLHVLGDRAVRFEELPLQNGFTKGLYDWERDYFREHILGRWLQAPDLWAPAAKEYCDLRIELLAEPAVPIHRDLQSANIMILDDEPYLIDFQGMRLGCAAYDIASLLYDPYKHYPASLRLDLWHCYSDAVRHLGGSPAAETVFHAAACQRLLQALGAYGKLWLGDGLEWYRQFIAPGLSLLTEAAHSGGYPALADMAVRCLALHQRKAGDKPSFTAGK